MKRMFLPAMMIAALASVVACNKDDNDAPSNNDSLSKLRAKWGIETIVLDLPGTEEDETYTGVTADYIEFRSDNKAYSEIDGEKDTISYSLVNDSKLVLDGDTTNISKLTGSELVFGQSYTEEGTTSSLMYNLKK